MKNQTITEIGNARVLDKNAPFAIREAFNMLRTNLMYTITETQEGCPIYAITSTSENAGKSTVIANLALSFTNLSKKVLLIDGDMRCPSLFRFFDLDTRHAGLSELISGIETDVMVKDIRPGLDIITSGRIPPNPSELITSPRFIELLEQWKKEYDIIFIDFPPIGIVADSITVSKNITGYIFTVRAGKSSVKAVNAAIASMEQIGAKIVGVVLNDYNIKGSKQYRYNHSRYFKPTMSKYEASAIEQSAESNQKVSDRK
ncbi:MAG: CpsD/CapB family tyrosine-protein kinase [Clostridia bacterium]|nr:CpsD/CapB family tyrosine-protein kinase [Clostridia bacterium]